MKFEIFNTKTNKVWEAISSKSVTATNRAQFELEIYKKLLNFFHVGDYYYVIFNLNIRDFDFVSPDVVKVLGYEPSEFNTLTYLEIIHPEDQPWLLTYETKASEFLRSLPVDKLMKYKVRYDLRFKKKDGGYVHILHQAAIVEHDELGNITRTLCVETDITHLKKTGKPLLSYIGLEGEPSYIDIDVDNQFLEKKKILSKREKEVLLLLIDGNLSKEIGDILNITKLTVDNHRKNMLKRNGLKTTAELVGKAINNGWL
jgi:DNA-binding CsgD family transcriptional regulator